MQEQMTTLANNIALFMALALRESEVGPQALEAYNRGAYTFRFGFDEATRVMTVGAKFADGKVQPIWTAQLEEEPASPFSDN